MPIRPIQLAIPILVPTLIFARQNAPSALQQLNIPQVQPIDPLDAARKAAEIRKINAEAELAKAKAKEKSADATPKTDSSPTSPTPDKPEKLNQTQRGATLQDLLKNCVQTQTLECALRTGEFPSQVEYGPISGFHV